jgi:acyl transferase domain-containing protein/NAD(P)H-dependent flavin oxidoreductase YrpB (nitropropane dioxygenase family)/NAD(P)-dependent dehydrogenase (short-subunit alcohol dehydrogenase family)
MGSFRIIALTPPGMDDPAIAISASRAGELGVLSLERASDVSSARRALDGLAQHARAACGVRLDPESPVLTALVAELPSVVRTVVLTEGGAERLRVAADVLKRRGMTVLVEVTSTEQALAAEGAGADGLIAKGHEAAGWVGEETTFVLLQRLLERPGLPVWAYGGIGLHTAAAAHAAGAAGVVLDAQLALTRESSLPEAVREAVARMDGSETVCLGSELSAACRFYARPGQAAVEALRGELARLLGEDRGRADARAEWRRRVAGALGWGSLERNVWALGQDAAFAASLARQFESTAGVLAGMRQAIDEHVRGAKAHRPLDAEGPLAEAHGTRYPIAQGPMTRVSDRAEFALRVAEGGGLPFLALALMRGREVEALLKESQALLDGRSWGVGILGFVPLELRQEQMEVIRAYRPPFALIAGGRPDQARSLEKEGIPTYLHVPSPGLLRLFLQEGARRFVFEGRECGGHVGPRSSFVLWNLMVDVLLDLPTADLADCHVLFAGGVHDARSAAMVATLAAPLAERGARVGVLLGTAYLFTEEAVSSQAIVRGFQEEAIRCDRTVLLETGPGHSTRCAETAFADAFQREKQRLQREGKPPEEVRNELEMLNIGRLRVASKGVTRAGRPSPEGASAGSLVDVADEEQRREGMYMIGQVAALRDRTCTIEQLHQSVAVDGSARLGALTTIGPAVPVARPEPRPSQIAIVGMSCLLPKARDRHAYWDNILNKVNAITEIPKERWDSDLYFDADPRSRDKIYSRWGGFLDDEPFDPVEFGMPPNSLTSIDPMQLLALKAARAALRDAGYLERTFDRSRASVILGASGGTGDLGTAYLMRSSLPLLFGAAAADVVEGAGDRLPEWTEDSFAGLLLNVAAGRIANRFDFGGLNYIVDAACASSLTAVHLAVKELETRNTDMVLVGGVDTTQNPFGYLCFSKTRALSPTGQPRTFDATADGIAISEGIVMLLLKRLEDAERDGDRVYAVIQAVGGSSDGRAKGLTAPRPEGQVLALERAYAKAGVSPTTVGLFEAHGTGTVVGDRTEALALSTVLEEAGAAPRSVAVGSVKSMIGHTKATAGVAGLAKVALALYHKVLPPTLGVTQPNPKARFGDGPLCVNSEARPWIHGVAGHPRRAGVNAFGFGGTNFHAILEEYNGDFLPRESAVRRRPTELFVWTASSPAEIAGDLEALERALARGARPELADLAYTLWQVAAESARPAAEGSRLAIVAASLDDLRQKIGQARQALAVDAPAPLLDPRGIYFTPTPLARDGKVAFLFPGQGSQYPNMLRDLALAFAPVREAFERVDAALEPHYARPLSSYVYPPPAFGADEEKAQQQALTETHVAQPALGAADLGLFALLRSLGVAPDMVAGHSYGEYAALAAAGVFDEHTLALVSEARGRAIVEAAHDDLGTMAAVEAGPEAVASAIAGVGEAWVANLNSPEQTIVSGSRAGVEQALECLKTAGLRARPVPVACAFHSPLVAPARERLAHFLSQVEFKTPTLPVFSNTTAAPHSTEPREIAAVLAQHLVEPVRFAEEVGALYEAGARLFVEVGPRNVLTALVRQVLGDRPHVAIAVDAPGRPGLTQLHHALGQLAAQGVALQHEPLFAGRGARRLNLAALEADTREKPLSPTTWMVNGSGIRPASRPAEPARRPALPVPAVATLAAPQPNGKAHDMSHPSALAVLPAPPPNGTATVPAAASPMPAAPVPLAPATAVPDGSAQVMLQFQGLMARFLDTQRAVALAYLQGAPAAMPDAVTASAAAASVVPAMPVAAAPAPVLEAPTAVVVPPPVPPPPALAEAALPSAPAANGHAAAEPDRARLTEQLLRIVGERTGYPPDMLDLDVDIEADLGIDSIKRVEILGNVQRACLPPDRAVAEKSMEQLTGIKTLRGIVGWLENALEGGNGHASAAAGVKANGNGGVAAKAVGNGHAHGNGNGHVEGHGNGHVDGNGHARVDGNGQGNGHGNGHTVADAAPGAPRAAQPASEDELVVIPRSIRVAVDAPGLRGPAASLAAEGVVIVTDDGRGIAQAACEELRGRGGRVVLLRHHVAGGQNGHADPGVYQADLTDVSAVALLVEHVRREHGPVAGILHLLPLGDHPAFETMDLSAWRAALRRDVKSLFYLAREAARDLKQAGERGEGWLLAATAMGAAYASAPAGPFFPGQGALAGFVKSLALEWPGVHCKVVALDGHDAAAVRADELMAELSARDGLVEVAYTGGKRRALSLRLAPLDTREPARLEITPECVLLVTGGARGITAEVACELAERYRPTLLLVGRSPLPGAEEAAATRHLTAPAALKAALLDGLRQSGQTATVAQVEAAYQRLVRDREIRANVARMQAAGSTVRYYPVDARDEAAMKALVDGVYGEYGRLDGVVHGAGVIEDKLVEDKTTESFDRVFDTKAESAFVLARVLRPGSLRFLAFFGSASGPFGNRGQADYAAANEVLNKLALHLDRAWPARVVSLSWGPWLKTGMVSPEMQREFARRGVDLISIPTGCRLFDQELRHGATGEPDVVLAGGAWSAPDPEAREDRSARTDAGFPMLRRATFQGGGHVVEAAVTFDAAHDRYLLDHRMDANPVVPMAAALELMAEVVQKGWPDLHVIGVREMQLLRGVVLDQGPRAVKVIARAQVEPPHDRSGVDVNVEVRDAGGSGHLCYRATVELASALPEAPRYQPREGERHPFPLSVEQAYRDWLFHGPRLQGITRIEGISDRGIDAVLDAAAPPPCFDVPLDGRWLIDPVMFDSALQLFLLWVRARLDKTTLPSRFARYRRFGSLSDAKLGCHIQVLERSRDPLYYLDIAFVGPDGRVLGLLEGMEGTCSRALNRLVAQADRPALAGVAGESPSL